MEFFPLTRNRIISKLLQINLRFKMKKAVILLIMATLVSLKAATVYVNDDATGMNNGTSWVNAYNSFQTALNSSVSGDQIWVASGIYKPESSYDLPNSPRFYHFRMKSGVEIYGGFAGSETSADQRTNFAHGGINETILSGDIGTEGDSSDNCYHVFYHPAGINLYITALLDGFTVTGGNADGTYPHIYGGGMYNIYCSLRLSNCEFISNSAYYGGGIYNHGSSPDITGCRFTGNHANMSGGGMFSTEYDSFPLVKYCTFTSNSSGSGGAIYAQNSLLHVNYSVFMNNTATNNGGAIYCGNGSSYNLNNSSFTGNTSAYGGALYTLENSSYDIVNCDFISNSVSHKGGAVYSKEIHSTSNFTDCAIKFNLASSGGGIYNDNDSSPDIVRCIFESNTADIGGGMCNGSSAPKIKNCEFRSNTATVYYGGGIHNSSAIPTIFNCLFISNSAAAHGGGLDNMNSSAVITNCTFSQNSSQYGGGVYAYDSYTTLNNSIVWGNTASVNGNEIGMVGNIVQNYTTTMNYSCYGNQAGDFYKSGGSFVQTGTINSDPRMLKDFRLIGTSPCVNSGNNSYNSESYDLGGRQRIQNSTIDMGAYEWTDGSDPSGNVLYVDHSASGANTGFNWPDAFNSLQDALDFVIPGCEVWVAKGTYKPSSFYDLEIFYNDTIRNYHFRLINGVGIYGGFNGNETVLGQRDFSANETILSGDVGFSGYEGDNCYNVIYNPSQTPSIDSTAVIDGFTITGASYENGSFGTYGGGMRNENSSPTIANCNFLQNNAYEGGGMSNKSSSSPLVTNCRFIQNQCFLFGGGVYNGSSSFPKFTDCEFISNTSGYGGALVTDEASMDITNCLIIENTAIYGGGLFNMYATIDITGCTLSGNIAVPDADEEAWGGGMCNMASEVTLNNSIISGNQASHAGNEIYIMALATETTALNYSCYSNGPNDIVKYDSNGIFLPDAYCITSDPAFVDPAGGDYRLYGFSPAVNTGNNSYNLLATDIRGKARIQNAVIDMGAYEWTSGTDPMYLLAPSDLTILRGVSSTQLDWAAVSGASIYKIYRSDDPYGTFTEIDTSVTNSYQDTDVAVGNKYFYYVTADNAK
jgi:predicted outer membrane repeat protein